MRVRLKFFKYGTMKYIGHLDMLRYFQKAFRRAHVPMKYSEGFNPHPVMSFAAPLGVGITSEGEYLDIETDKDVDLNALVSDINSQMVEGCEVSSARELVQNEKKAMAAVTAADYIVYLKKESSLLNETDVKKTVDDFMAQDAIRVVKKTKKGEREIDLKPFVYDFKGDTFASASFLNDLVLDIKNPEFCCENNDPVFFLKVSCGSNDNTKPELVLTTCFEQLMDKENIFAIHRRDLYLDEYPNLKSLGEAL